MMVHRNHVSGFCSPIRRTLLLLFFTLGLGPMPLFWLNAGGAAKTPLESLAIHVTSPSRPFIYTNKASAFLYGETNDVNHPGWQGFTVFGHKFLDDILVTANGEQLDRHTATTTVFPHFLRRVYKVGIVEEIHPVDSLAAFFITLTFPEPTEAGILPLLSDGREDKDFNIRLSPGTTLIARTRHLLRTEKEDYPVWLAVHAPGFAPARKIERIGNRRSVAALYSSRIKSCTVVFAVGDNEDSTAHLARIVMGATALLSLERQQRMINLLRDSETRTGNARFDKALAWAKISLDALIMDQRSHGIFAGLPWFDSYWGRDTFISLPGATLVTGRDGETRRILESFAEFQERDSSSSDYGRIPNIVTTTEKGYNTADGTPRFVTMVRAYVERTGDLQFGLNLYPVILRAMEGTIRYHVDSLGFLTHGDAETWMDAVGPEGPWSPRGSRANDVQALWAAQLEAGIFFATRVGDVTSAREWNEILQRLHRNFPTYFVRQERVADYLHADGTPDLKLRPNQIFALPLLADSEKIQVVEEVVSRLTYPYGVASLSQDDPNFHPYHQHPPFYPKDAAYHNGTVWTWLQGPVISALCDCGAENLAFDLTTNAVRQILDRGAVGTQSELLDAQPHPGEKLPRLSGTVSQAWNLGEFVRNFYDDYLGLRVDLLQKKLILHPHMPNRMHHIAATIPVHGASINVTYAESDNDRDMKIASTGSHEPLKVEVRFQSSNATAALHGITLVSGKSISIKVRNGQITLATDGKSEVLHESWKTLSRFARVSPNLQFAQPVLRRGLPALGGPSYPLLTHDQILHENTHATPLVNAMDPAGEDNGTTNYSYPKASAFAPGSFDLRSLKISYDKANVYFQIGLSALSDPGWHPEYGFQLTFVALAIDKDGVPGSGARAIGHNAGFVLPDSLAYETIIFVGGGIQIESRDGTIVGAYVPVEADASQPFGNAAAGIIRFALPVSMIGTPSSSWRVTVLSGGQDDHGGAGIGEYRSVLATPGEWNGGGKVREGDPNIYDTLIAIPGK